MKRNRAGVPTAAGRLPAPGGQRPRERVAKLITEILIDILGMVIDRLAGADKKARAKELR